MLLERALESDHSLKCARKIWGPGNFKQIRDMQSSFSTSHLRVVSSSREFSISRVMRVKRSV